MLLDRRLKLLSKISMVATISLVLAAAGEAPAGTGGIMARPSDPEKAVQAEYENLKSKGTREALELFIARHPDHPLADRAREEIKGLAR
jgi:hypothetical protein|nr:hypothetical protein [Shinella sp. HZN7]